MANVLYISLTGMTEPLGRSQVLEYLIDLSKSNNIYLISFEREKDLENIEEVQNLIKDTNIKWDYFIYSNKYGVFSSINQIIKAYLKGKKIIKQKDINIIHSRSFIPAVIGYLLKNKKVKLLFDIRGFAIDEKVDSGRLKKNSLLFLVLKKLDDYLYKNSDHIVTLTHKAKEILNKNLKIDRDKITVIPTCANKEIFKIISDKEKKEYKKELGFSEEDIILIHTGTVSGWYDFDKELILIKKLFEKNKNIKFLILNKNEKEFIEKKIENYKLPKSRIKILSSSFSNVYKFLNISNFSIFFIKPSYSKQASAPTKFAENVACYLPSITNTGVGDMEYYLTNYNVGILLDLKDIEKNLEDTALKILQQIENFHFDKNEFDKLFKEHFDKKMAIKKYNGIYKELIRY